VTVFFMLDKRKRQFG